MSTISSTMMHSRDRVMRRQIAVAVAWSSLLVGTLLTASEAMAQSWRSMTSERQVWNTEPHRVKIDYGAGTLRIEPADEPTLYRLEMRYDEESVSPIVEYDEARRRIRLGAEGSTGLRRNVRGESSATIGLTREVPMDVEVNFGAGEANLDLGGIRLRSLEIATGASETSIQFRNPNPIEAEKVRIQAGAADLQVIGIGNTRARQVEFKGGVGETVLDLSGAWGTNASVSVEMGIGALTVRLPRSIGVRVNRQSFLTSFSAPGLERRGDGYFSENWETAANRLTVDIRAALGSIDIRWVD